VIARIRTIVAMVLLAAAPAFAGDAKISQKHLHDHIKYLASDDLAGRAPGSPGEDKTVAYLTGELKKAGCEPGNPDGGFTQTVPLYGYTVTNAPALALTAADGKTHTFANGSEFVAWTMRQEPHTSLQNGELVFVGYGVDAPEYQWNDYENVDVTGKVVVMLVNDPPLPDERFGGRAMTYYGRWTYKFEQAAAQGAAGAILVHNTEAAGYPWAVVENSWSGEQFDVVRADGGKDRCAFESWVTEDAARELFKMAGRDFDQARQAAATDSFRADALGLTASVRVENRTRTIQSRNVIGMVGGADPERRNEYVVYTAHWDHLGVGKAADGDSIYNGALDNASGVAGVLEIARSFAANRATLKRSVLFLFTTGEESGLLGATYYTENPLYPLARTMAEINIDGVNIWGRTTDMVVVGSGQSNLEDILVDVLKTMDRTTQPDSEPEKGYYYRSDHFPFAKHGVPALYSDSGVEMRDRPTNYGMERRREYVAERYHKPQDEYDPAWDLSGAAEDMEALYRVGLAVAADAAQVRWSEKSEFRRVRERMLQGGK
jgi:Zn-dependent M28 family amino/carboxypeptidase